MYRFLQNIFSSQSVESSSKQSVFGNELNSSVSSEMFGLALIMITIQVMDGILTGIGVRYFGVALEGNFFIQGLMHNMGYVEALFIVKLFAILAIALLSYRAAKKTWIPRVMECIISVYLFIVVIPWSFVLLNCLD